MESPSDWPIEGLLCEQTARVRIARDELRRIRDLTRAIT
jgi:hypothetical protein